jgi:hypothetical protein
MRLIRLSFTSIMVLFENPSYFLDHLLIFNDKRYIKTFFIHKCNFSGFLYNVFKEILGTISHNGLFTLLRKSGSGSVRQNHHDTAGNIKQ